MKSDILISVIIPVYNVEPYLAECLDSILNQAFHDYEIICIDDASTDNSYKILQEYESRFSQIKILKNTVNKGLSYTRNRGMKESVGKYIMFVDSDDMLKKGSLERIRQLLEEYKGIDILYYDMEIRNEGKWAKEQIERALNPVDEVAWKVCTGMELFVQLQKKDALFVEVVRQMLKRDFLIEKNLFFYDGIYHEDNLFSFYSAMNAKNVVYVPQVFYLYRRRDASIMSTMNLKRVQSYFIVFIELWNYWKNGEWSEAVNGLFDATLSNLYKVFASKVNYYQGEVLNEFGSAADQFMYRLISDNRSQIYEYIISNQSLICEAGKASSIMVYGAGNVGIEVVRLLQSRNIAIDKIVVSNKQSNPEKLLGVPIVEFDGCKVEEGTMIIIAVLKSNEKAIACITENIRKYTNAKVMLYDGTIL